MGRPLLKATVKSALILARAGRVRLENRETLADMTVEAQTELDRTAAEGKYRQPIPDVKERAAGVM
jgi:hypothetical protein